ncbi:phosphopantetheinyl transferase-like protein [Streptomyces sp. NBC_00555]|uniref:4'-phosphopantetheinyl transferase family protein n=1 Tax=Streptomyces sp. NBC_00555 TaxID=2903662 RepID=UPI00225B5F3F|nr:4'-phosphopantetheinyl transferase superfamily protein [Streptomyces sp. NBC_00555]MCX5011195.1 phosphopantetheinyl transferase-like protein [Streptomyces sp. NBC_00555]
MDAWLVDLDEHAWSPARYANTGTRPGSRARATPEESRRAAEFTRASSTRRFLRARLAVRELLGERLAVPPAELRVARTPDGKPYLPDHPHLHISWSRSERLLLLAAADTGPIGVDIEWLRPMPAALDALATVYPALPVTAEPEVFLPAWTLLEAAVKATGLGLARGAKDVDLALGPGNTVSLRGIVGHGPPDAWYGRTEPLAASGALPAAVVAVVTRDRPPMSLNRLLGRDRPMPAPTARSSPDPFVLTL